MRRLIQDALVAQSSGVVCSLREWKRLDTDERAAWLAARKLLAGAAAPTEGSPTSPAEDDVDQVEDLELRAALERGVEAIERARAEG